MLAAWRRPHLLKRWNAMSFPERALWQSSKGHRCTFHSTPPRKAPYLDICLVNTHAAIEALHSATGLPWVLTLPLVAVLVRIILMGPISIMKHRRSERLAVTRPMISAWVAVLRARNMAEHHDQGAVAVQKRVLRELKQVTRSLQKRMGIKSWQPFAPLVQLPVWLLLVETIRKMCGTHEGLLALVARWPAISGSHEELPSTDNVGSAGEAPLIPIEAGFSTEGALWFSNLLVPDPQLLLPFMLSAVMFSNVYLQEREQRASGAEPGKWAQRFVGSLKLVALAVGPLTLQLPSAMLVYWLASATSGLVQNLVLDRVLRRRAAIKPCKRKQIPHLVEMTSAAGVGSR